MKSIPGFDRYMINEQGEVYNNKTKRFAKQWKDPDGYFKVCITSNECKHRRMFVHRLVALTFIPNTNEKPNVCHKDGNPANPSIDNLYWGDQKDNCADMKAHGTTQQGTRHHNVILTEAQVREIRSRQYKYGDQTKTAREFGISVYGLHNILKRHTWAHIL